MRLLASLRVLVDALDLGQKISSSVTLPSLAKHRSFLTPVFGRSDRGRWYDSLGSSEYVSGTYV